MHIQSCQQKVQLCPLKANEDEFEAFLDILSKAQVIFFAVVPNHRRQKLLLHTQTFSNSKLHMGFLCLFENIILMAFVGQYS